MNTKTMRLPPRRVVTSSTNKRKEREGYDSLKPLPPPEHPHPPQHLNRQPHPAPAPPPLPLPPRAHKPADSAQAGSDKPSSQLLAGYLAHEFLTRGTLLGKPWDPALAEPSAEPSEEEVSRRRYVEVSFLLRAGDGAHLPGIVNPTQLARFLH